MRVPGIPYVQGRNAYADADGTKYGIAIHNTANDATAEGEASYATRRTDGISAHFYADNNSVIQSLDTRDRAGHAGSTNGNQHAVAVEITGTNGQSRAWWLANVAWDKLGAVLAQVCRAYNIQVRRANVAEMDTNPKVRAFYSHNDMRLAWGGTTHTDPGPNFPWDRLFQAVNAHLDGEDDDMTPKELIDTKLGSPALGDRTVGDWWKAGESARREAVAAKTAAQAAADKADEVAGSLAELAERIARIEQHLTSGAGGVTLEMHTAALRAVLGSVDGATPQQ